MAGLASALDAYADGLAVAREQAGGSPLCPEPERPVGPPNTAKASSRRQGVRSPTLPTPAELADVTDADRARARDGLRRAGVIP